MRLNYVSNGVVTQEDVDANLGDVRYMLERQTHPNPLVSCVSIFAILLVLYILKSMWIDSLNGDWYTASGDLVAIRQALLSNRVVRTCGESVLEGLRHGNVVVWNKGTELDVGDVFYSMYLNGRLYDFRDLTSLLKRERSF